jgi:alpha-aminoadipic semialdehyde synthase
MHPKIAEQCINLSKHMVTASYISPALANLDSAAKEKGVTLMNEIGLDPGIDHLTALSAFDDIKSEGSQVTHFESWCGGLPAPEASDNPLGYKFSWSPQGVLLAASNSASHLLESKKVDIPGPDLLKAVVDVPIMKGFALEGYPNRDSLKYISLYNLNPSKLRTMFRGTLRYKGFADQMDAFKRLGLLKQEAVDPSCRSWVI